MKNVNATLESLREVIDVEFTGLLKKKLEDVYRVAGTMSSASRGEKGERESRAACMVSDCSIVVLYSTKSNQLILNDLDVSSLHLERLMKDFLVHPTISQNFLASEQQALKDSLSSFFSATLSNLRTSVKVKIMSS